jgi:hypothetical protein
MSQHDSESNRERDIRLGGMCMNDHSHDFIYNDDVISHPPTVCCRFFEQDDSAQPPLMMTMVLAEGVTLREGDGCEWGGCEWRCSRCNLSLSSVWVL